MSCLMLLQALSPGLSLLVATPGLAPTPTRKALDLIIGLPLASTALHPQTLNADSWLPLAL
jgi:hypothetical protein